MLGLLLVELGRRRRRVALGTAAGAVIGATIVSVASVLGLLLVELGRRRRSVALGTVGGAVTGATIVSVASVLGLLLVEVIVAGGTT